MRYKLTREELQTVLLLLRGIIPKNKTEFSEELEFYFQYADLMLKSDENEKDYLQCKAETDQLRRKVEQLSLK